VGEFRKIVNDIVRKHVNEYSGEVLGNDNRAKVAGKGATAVIKFFKSDIFRDGIVKYLTEAEIPTRASTRSADDIVDMIVAQEYKEIKEEPKKNKNPQKVGSSTCVVVKFDPTIKGKPIKKDSITQSMTIPDTYFGPDGNRK
jgi:hypothetical protein